MTHRSTLPAHPAGAVAVGAWRRYIRRVPGEWFEWEWDETLFAGAAPHYRSGRLPYAAGLAASFAKSLGLDGRGVLLDIGCGPGTLTLELAQYFGEVIGLDPDAGMIREARELTSRQGVGNATWLPIRAEELPAGVGPVRVATFAASFHWMDRPLVASTVREMLEPAGAVVHVDNHHQDSLAPAPGLPSPPRDRVGGLRRSYLGDDRRAGRSIRNSSPDDEDDVLRAAGYVGPERVVVPDGRVVVRSIDDLVHETFSMSSTAPHLFGDRVGEFESDLRRLLAEASPSGSFSERLPDNELKIWRPVVSRSAPG
jgi:SAM-dependent methyltransferase